MEKAPTNRTSKEIAAELGLIDKEIIELEPQLGAHSESGSNSPDDQGQEAAQDIQAIANGPGFKMAQLRHRKAELEEELKELPQAA